MKCTCNNGTLKVWGSELHSGYQCDTCKASWLPPKYLSSIETHKDFDTKTFKQELQKSAVYDEHKMCPSHCGHLHTSVINSAEISFCPSCSGVWFDNQQLNKLLSQYPSKLDDYSKHAYLEAMLNGLTLLFR
jgi:Zn-finger nucleic acid-binding protein